MNSQSTFCFSNFPVHAVCANCFQFMLIDAKDKKHVVKEQNHSKTHKYDMSGILLSQRLLRKNYDPYVSNNLCFPKVRAFSLYANSDSFTVTCTKIIELIFIIQLVIHLKRLESMDLEKIMLAVSRSKRNSHLKQFHE